MSNELTGAIAFQNQIASSKGMRAALHATLTDGILDGCALTYGVGLSCSIAAGFLIICGGVAHNPSSMTLNFSQSSGYVRIVANVDLSKSATESDFKQVFFSVDYSATVGGFPDLTQQDINMSGQLYQYEFAVIEIGVGVVREPIDAKSAAGVSTDLLWENASPSNAFPSQTISIDLSGYDVIAIESNQSSTQYTTNLRSHFDFMRKGLGYISTVAPTTGVSPTYGLYGFRTVESSDSGVTFGSGVYSIIAGSTAGGGYNDFLVPIKIYGVKGVG